MREGARNRFSLSHGRGPDPLSSGHNFKIDRALGYSVFFIVDAETDLVEIFDFIKESRFPINAGNLIAQIRKTCSDLSEFPERGRIVPELKRIGISVCVLRSLK